MLDKFKDVAETLRNRFSESPLGKQLEGLDFDGIYNNEDSSLDAYVSDVSDELCDDNENVYSIDEKLQPYAKYELNGNVYTTDEKGRIITEALKNNESNVLPEFDKEEDDIDNLPDFDDEGDDIDDLLDEDDEILDAESEDKQKLAAEVEVFSAVCHCLYDDCNSCCDSQYQTYLVEGVGKSVEAHCLCCLDVILFGGFPMLFCHLLPYLCRA